MRQMLKKLTTVGFRRAMGEMLDEARLIRRHRRGVRRARTLTVPRGAKLQLGCGEQPKAGWINVDLYNPSADLAIDLREDLPFPDDTFSMIYSEHVFEHIAYPTDAKHLLRECRRVLAPGGVFSVVVPDFGSALRAYVAGEERFFTGNDRLRSYLLREQPTLMHHVNYWFRHDGLHRYAYDAETLGQVLRDAGFTSVTERAFDPSLDSAKRHQLHSLYMQGIKPAAAGARTAEAEHQPAAPHAGVAV